MPTTTRIPSSGPDAGQAAASLDYGGDQRAAAMLLYREQLWVYIRSHGLGHEFQAVDFSAWLARQDERPDPAVIDGRATGGLFLDLVRAGIVEKCGYRNNGGDKSRNYNSCPRQSYRVVLLDRTRLGWIEERPPPTAPNTPEPDESTRPLDESEDDPSIEDPHQAVFEFA